MTDTRATLTLGELRQAALAAADSLAHAIPITTADTLQSADGLLTIRLADERIVAAAFRPTGRAEADAFVELYCREIEQLPCEEAAAYAASYVLHRLGGGRYITDCADCADYAGVASPRQVDAALADAEAALRTLRRQWRQRRNDPTPPPIDTATYLALPADWLALSDADRLAALRAALAAATANGDIIDCRLVVEQIENDIRRRPVRVTLTYPKDADTAALPDIMRRIERLFRQSVAPWLEVYADERQDHNKLRRTILVDHRPKTT